MRKIFLLLRHLLGLWRGGQLRFRMETFGLYYPTPPYTAPAWRMSPRMVLLLLRRAPAYIRWLEEMERVEPRRVLLWKAGEPLREERP